MGAVTVVMGLINRVVKGERPEVVVREAEEDPFLARSLQIDEDIRTGRNRPLSPEEQRRFIERVRRGGK
jgi:hypothetical protein